MATENEIDPVLEEPPIAVEEKEPSPGPRRRRSAAQQRWIDSYWPDLLIILAIGAAVVLFLNPFPAISGPLSLIHRRLATWLVRGGGALFVAVIWTLLLFPAVLWRIHWRVVHVKRWSSRQCPRCHSNELKRIHRTNFAHFLNRLNIPARSYFCPNCRWRGVRIDEAKV